MSDVTERSHITTIRTLEASEREGAARRLQLTADGQQASSQRWAEEADHARRRLRQAEADRQAALAREVEQHTAKLAAMQQAIVERARCEASERFQVQRLAQQYAHEQAMTLLTTEARLGRLRRCLFVVTAVAVVVTAGAVGVLAHAAEAQAVAAELHRREATMLRARLKVAEEQLAIAIEAARTAGQRLRALSHVSDPNRVLPPSERLHSR